MPDAVNLGCDHGSLLTDPSSILAVVRLLQLPGPHYVIFTADSDPFTGNAWCPDCVRTVPAVRRMMHSAGASLLEVEVGPRPAWKSPAHPFRWAGGPERLARINIT
jgi:hypothetical protein